MINSTALLDPSIVDSSAATAIIDILSKIVPYQYVALSGEVLTLISTIVVIASLITASTKTPSPDTTWGKIYRVVEILALVVGKAKDKSIPKIDGKL